VRAPQPAWLCAEHFDEWVREGGAEENWQSEDTGAINQIRRAAIPRTRAKACS